MIKVCLVGYGYWGKNLLRNLQDSPLFKVKYVCESNDALKEKITSLYPNVKVISDYKEAIQDELLDAIVIATPTHTHFEIAKNALSYNKHVLVEKPFTTSTKQAMELIELSQLKKRVLMVDHTFLYSGAVEKIKQLIEDNCIGRVKYFDSTRINLGIVQSDVNVLWDLAPHDLSILSYIIKDFPISVIASGVSHTNNDIENIAYMILKYDSGLIAHLNCSWTSPVKVRTILIGGDKKMILYDDINPTDKIRLYDSGIDIKPDDDRSKLYVDYRVGDVYIPKLKTDEPLKKMLDDFANSIIIGTTPRSNWENGLKTVKILEAAQESIKNNGKQVLIS